MIIYDIRSPQKRKFNLWKFTAAITALVLIFGQFAFTPGKARAADTTLYVNTASTAGGDCTTNATTGANRACATLSAAEALIPADITAAGSNGIWTIVAEGQNADTQTVTFSGTVTDATHYIKVTTDAAATYGRHIGVWNSTKYRLTVSNASAITVGENYVWIDGLQIQVTSANGNLQNPISFSAIAVSPFWLSNSILRGHGNATYSEYGIGTSANGQSMFVWNSIVYGISTNASSRNIVQANTGTGTFYNNTIIGGTYGLRQVSGSIVAKNVYVGGSVSGDYSGIITMTTSASSDTSAAGTALDSIALNTSNFTNVTAGSENFHLPVGSALIGAGTNTSGDAAPMNFTTDIDAQTRSVPWDIGADEYVLGSNKAITSFDFNGLSPAVTGAINETNHTVTLTVPYGTDVTALAPTIAITGTSVSPNSGVAQNFTNSVTYTVTAEDASTQDYTVSANFTYTVGGTISGLTGTVVLQNNSRDDISNSSNGGFTFATPLANGGVYDVTVSSQPTDQTCMVINGAGNISGANVTNVSVACAIITQTFYIDYDGGSDSNDGTSKNTPWKHAPGMNGCSDNCAVYQTDHSSSAGTTGAGDEFIFKGGVTWSNEVFTWDWNLGGGTGWTKGVDAIYFGIDQTWYSGASWTRPVFDAGGTAISANARTSTANTMFRVYKASGGYFIIDNLEFKGLPHLDNTERAMVSLSALYSELKNSYFHGWSHGGIATSDNFRVITSSYDTPNLTVSIHHNVIDGSDSSPTPGDMAAALKGHAGQFYNNYVGYVQNGEVSNRIGYVWGNTFDHVAYVADFDATQHHQNYQSYGDGDGYIYNNLSINPAGGSTYILYPTNLYKFYIFNNVVTSDTNQTLQLSSNELTEANTAGFYVWNNTFQAPVSSSAVLINGPAGATYVSEMTVRNNHVIATNNNVNMGNSTAQINTNHLGQTNAGATSAEYVPDSTYPYQPPNSSAVTVDTGYMMSAFCSSLTDYFQSTPSADCLKDTSLGVSYNTTTHTVSYPYRIAVTRSTWDIGAYEYVAPADSTAPVRSAGSPSGIQSSGTTQVTMSLTTDENSTCKYSKTASTTYSSMTNIFSTTASTSHSSIISVSNGNSYNYYVRCTDGTNINSDDYTISFSVASPSTSSSSGGGGGGGGGSSISSDSSTQTSTTTSTTISTSTSAIASTTIATSTSATSIKQEAVSEIVSSAEIVSYVFIRNLAFGERSEDVKHLQEILAQDKEIYPEGIISGYYGFLTQKAVERFQIKRQIVSSGTAETTGFGLVGPLTRTKINEVFGKNEEIIQPSTTTEQQISISAIEQPIADVQSQTVNSQQISEIKEQIKQFQTLLVSLLQQLVEIILRETEKMIP